MEFLASKDGLAAWVAVVVSLIGTFVTYFAGMNKRDRILKTIEIYKSWESKGSSKVLELLKADIESSIMSMYRRFPIAAVGIPFLLLWIATVIAGIANLVFHYTDFFGGILSNTLGVLLAGMMTYVTMRLFWRE